MAASFVNMTIIPATDKTDTGLIKQVHDIFSGKGFEVHSHGTGLNIYGDMDAVLAAVKEAIAAVHAAGIDRAYTFLQIETRESGVNGLEQKLKAVA